METLKSLVKKRKRMTLLRLMVMSLFLFLSSSVAIEASSSLVPAKRPLTSTTNSGRRVSMGPDGTLYLKDESEKVYWKVSSGPPTYSSYHQKGDNRDDLHIDLGEDGKLYLQRGSMGKSKLSLSAEDFVKRSPLITPSGGVLFASKRAAVFVVGVRSGRIFRRFASDSPPSLLSIGVGEHAPIIARTELDVWLPGSPPVTDEPIYYIRKIDYVFSYQSIKLAEALWYLAFSEIEVLYGCPLVEDFVDGLLQAKCEGRLPVYREIDGSLALHGGVGDALLAGGVDHLSPVELKQEDYVRSPVVYYLPIIIAITAAVFIVAIAWRLLHQQTPKEVTPKPTEVTHKKKSKKGKGRENSDRKNESGSKETSPYKRKDNGRSKYVVHRHTEIGIGSNGTIVYEGEYNGSLVAVKQIPKIFYRRAMKEYDHLYASDRNENIVRLYGREEDDEYVYLFLERCTCNLQEFIIRCSKGDDRGNLLRPLGSMDELKLWKNDGYPSPLLLNLVGCIISGLAHLHDLGIIHRDLKPQNILLVKDGSIRAKISDKGISKRLQSGTSISTNSTVPLSHLFPKNPV